MNIAVYPGSFDPITMGHLDIIERASKIFDRLIVVVLTNSRKKTVFPAELRADFIRRVARGIANVEVDCSSGLLADYAARRGSGVIVKGLRAMSDFESEFQQALLNRKIGGGLETLFLTTSDRYLYLSSSAVREIGGLGGDISGLIPPEIYEEVRAVLGGDRSDRTRAT